MPPAPSRRSIRYPANTAPSTTSTRIPLPHHAHEWADYNVRNLFLPRRFESHMIEETGRHAGDADILRELIDGAAGH
ncbi:mycothiol transferase [Nocardia sp. CY41]|uniref:mycothiol transferase n=1 Tax=Nocardia sp. CY41 TaxID=2608686 RepID=UPI001F1C5F60|nr:DUF664 domain-containing protein [Nocardia sp. CY41]